MVSEREGVDLMDNIQIEELLIRVDLELRIGKTWVNDGHTETALKLLAEVVSELAHRSKNCPSCQLVRAAS